MNLCIHSDRMSIHNKKCMCLSFRCCFNTACETAFFSDIEFYKMLINMYLFFAKQIYEDNRRAKKGLYNMINGSTFQVSQGITRTYNWCKIHYAEQKGSRLNTNSHKP